jgi:hypothetical protein
VLALLRAEEIADFTDGAPEGVDGPDAAGSQKGFQLGKSHLDWIEVGTRCSFENEPVHRRVNDEGDDQGVIAGRRGRSVSSNVRTALSKGTFGPCDYGRAGASSCRRSSLVQEDYPVWLKPHDRLARRGPFLARPLDLGPIMLAGPQSFFEAIANADEPTRKRGGIDLLAGGGGKLRRQLRHGDVGLLADLLQKKKRSRTSPSSSTARQGQTCRPAIVAAISSRCQGDVGFCRRLRSSRANGIVIRNHNCQTETCQRS